jgi:pyridoxal phosphate enzyme (YggS family)
MIRENLAQLRKRIGSAAERAGRAPENIRLVCVSKTATAGQIREAISCGITDIGENRVQDALLKYNQLGEAARKAKWHMIGHLQTNKVKKALEIFDLVHSLDSLNLAEEIGKRAAALGKIIDCFIEVNTSSEATKYGIRPEETLAFVRRIASLPNLKIIGLMTMAPLVEDPELTRPYFSRLRDLRDRLQAENIANTDIKELSMGMSQDFEVAIEEGSTFIRVGTAIFSG